MSENNIKPAIEALLFASDRPLTIEQIKKVLGDLGANELRSTLEELKSEYEQDSSGIRIAEIAGGFQMITSPALAFFLKKLYKERRLERLSKPALETLAIIAYKQPLTKLEIETLRNVNVDGVIKTLLDKGLIRVAGRRKCPGRPYAFGTTKQFLEYFALKSLDDLPKMEEFNSLAKPKDDGAVESQEKTIIEQVNLSGPGNGQNTEAIDGTKEAAQTN